jgi:hypothetical protein
MKKFIIAIISALCLILASSCEKLNIDQQENYTEQDLTGMWHLVQTDSYYWDAKYDDYGRESVYMEEDPDYCWEFRGNELIVYYAKWEWQPVSWNPEREIAKYGYYVKDNLIFVNDTEKPNEYIIEKVEGNNLWLSYYSNRQIRPFPKEGSEDEVVYKYRYMNKTVLRFRIKGTELTGKVDYSYGLE